MQHTEDRELNRYWYSFGIGLVLGAGGMYLLGTKHGRTLLKKITESFEHIEEIAEEYIDNFSEKI